MNGHLLVIHREVSTVEETANTIVQPISCLREKGLHVLVLLHLLKLSM